MKEQIARFIKDSVKAKSDMLVGPHIETIESAARAIADVYKRGGKVVAFGNGGSASDAQHFVAELVVRFEVNRRALAAIALTTNTSVMTAVGNDFKFEDVFKRQVEALVNEGDVVFAISTSGKSPNVVAAIEKAKEKKAVVIGFTGQKGVSMKEKCDICFLAPGDSTARVQECHILAIHIICSLLEETLFGKK